VVHAGVGVSYGLEKKESDAERLLARGLPIVSDGAGLAKLMGIPLGTLWWLTFHRRGAALVHYRRFGIPKKSGGVRSISAPKKKLAAAQRWVFERVLMKLAPEPEAHGFVSGRSIMSNAAPHVGRAVVINLDLKDFFPSITFRRVKGLFRAVGYSEHAATLLGLLCTEPPRVEAELDGKSYYVALGERILPQGASTSPAITNALCRRLDRRLAGLAKRHGFSYTRYADDLTFSGQKASAAGRLLKSVRGILADEGFVEHPSKTKVMRRARRQEVTGLVVNAKPAVDRREVRKLRAILHNAEKHGLKSQNRDNHPDFRAHLIGRVGFVAMVDPERAAPLKAALERVLARS
jgi:retron-type reverse transcriptase